MIFTAITDIWSAFQEFDNQALLTGLSVGAIYSLAIIIINIYKFTQKKTFDSVGRIILSVIVSTLIGIYGSYIVFLTLSGREAGSRSGYLCLIPGTTIFTGQGISIFSVENLLLFMPLGILCPLVTKHFRSALNVGVLAFVMSLSIEICQRITGRGFFEIDDIILNTLGALLGYLLFAYIFYSYLGMCKRILLDKSKSNNSPCTLPDIYSTYMLSQEYLLIILQAIPVVAIVYMIMGFSSDPGQISRNWSRPVAFGAAKIASFFSKDAALSVSEISDLKSLMSMESLYLDFIEKVIRKLAHITEYGLLAFVVWVLIFSRPYIKKYSSYISGIVVVFFVGLIDEFNQTRIYGRYGSLVDVLVDLSGAILAMLIAYILSTLITKHYNRSGEGKPRLL